MLEMMPSWCSWVCPWLVLEYWNAYCPNLPESPSATLDSLPEIKGYTFDIAWGLQGLCFSPVPVSINSDWSVFIWYDTIPYHIFWLSIDMQQTTLKLRGFKQQFVIISQSSVVYRAQLDGSPLGSLLCLQSDGIWACHYQKVQLG